MGVDIEAYLAAVRKHEMLHSELMKAALSKNDPGPKIESLASKEKGPLKSQADKVIAAAEEAIDKASADPLPSIGYKAKVAFPDDATDKYFPVELEF